MTEKFCAICGKYFEGYGTQKTCSVECRAERERMLQDEENLQKRIATRKKKMANNKLEQTLAECQRQGISYAEYKKKQMAEELKVKV